MEQLKMSHQKQREDGYYTYNEHSIKNMSSKPQWTKPIPCPEKSKTGEYILVATGECSIEHGREYIALPSDTSLSDWRVKEKYNLM